MATLNLKNASSVRINFTNRGMTKVLKDGSALSQNTPSRENIVNLSRLIGDVKIDRGEPIKFSTLPELLGVDYIGYIIEKERLNKVTGEWERIDEYRIIGTESNSFVDTRIAYGESYRYRMKSIMKVSQSVVKMTIQDNTSVQSAQSSNIQTTNENLRRRESLLQHMLTTNRGLSSKTSGGVTAPVIKLDDTTSLKINPGSTEVITTADTDNKNLRLNDKLRVYDESLARGDTTNKNLKIIYNDNINTIRNRKIDYESIYYESNPTKNWLYVDVIDDTPPPWPQTIKITPDSLNKSMLISWLKPANDQRDIKYFKVYRRSAVGTTWTLLTTTREIDVNQDGYVSQEEREEADAARLPVNTNIFIDKGVDFGQKYIYATTCVDVHEIESFLSMQIQAELNPKFALEKKEKPLKWISGGGAKLSETNYIVKKFLDRNEQLIAKSNIYIAPSTKFAEVSKTLLIKVKSLDTHITHEIKVVLKNTNITETET